jgi:hypothetical protein
MSKIKTSNTNNSITTKLVNDTDSYQHEDGEVTELLKIFNIQPPAGVKRN